MKKAWSNVQFILFKASPNAKSEINSPPHAVLYIVPLAGVDMQQA